MPASKVGSLMNLLPLGTLFFGWLLLGETLAFMQYVAAGLVLLGVIWSQTKPKAKKKTTKKTTSGKDKKK